MIVIEEPTSLQTESEGSKHHIDDVLKQKLEEVLCTHTYEVQVHDMAKIASEHDAIDLAYAVGRLPYQARLILFETLDDPLRKVTFLINVDVYTRAHILRQLEDLEIVELLSKMPIDEAAWVLDDVSDRKFRRLIRHFDARKSARLSQLRNQDRHTAARMMVGEFLAFDEKITIGQVFPFIPAHPKI